MSFLNNPVSSPTIESPAVSPQSRLRPQVTFSNKCISALNDITSQLLYGNLNLHVQCLAFTQAQGDSEQLRCTRNFTGQSNPVIYNRAKNILQQDNVVDANNYVENVARILFCEIHSRLNVFKTYHKSLREHWKGDGCPEEIEALEAIRQAFQLSAPENNSVKPMPPPPNGPTRPNLEMKIFHSSPQIPNVRTQARDPNALIPPPQRTRSFSNPSLPSHKIGIEEITLGMKFWGNKTQEQNSQDTSPIQQMPVFSSSSPGTHHQTHSPLQFREEQLISNPMLTMEQSKLSILWSKQVQIPREDWAQMDFESAFGNSHPALFESHVRPTVTRGMSKDDILLRRAPSQDDCDTFIPQQTPIPDRASRRPVDDHNNIPVETCGKFVDHDIRKAIMEHVAESGHVYVLKAPGYFASGNKPACVKIGRAIDVDAHMSSIEDSCGIKNLQWVRDSKDRPHHLNERIEKLAQAELGNFQRPFYCSGCKSLHKEWFEVPEEVALQVVQRWRKFVMQEPYDKNGNILSHWSEMLLHENMTFQDALERDDDHEKRNERWTKWLERGIASKEQLQPAI